MSRMLPVAQGFSCVRCGAVTLHPVDVADGWCDVCRDFTGTQAWQRAWHRAHHPDGYDADDPPLDGAWDEDHD